MDGGHCKFYVEDTAALHQAITQMTHILHKPATTTTMPCHLARAIGSRGSSRHCHLQTRAVIRDRAAVDGRRVEDWSVRHNDIVTAAAGQIRSDISRPPCAARRDTPDLSATFVIMTNKPAPGPRDAAHLVDINNPSR